MNPTDMTRIIIRRGWIVILAALLVAGTAFAFSKIQTPVYRSTQKILVKPARNDYGLSQTLLNLLNSYKAWMETKDRAARVIDGLKLDMKPDALAGMVAVTVDRNSNLLLVDVDMTNGDVANDVARSYGEIFQQWRTEQNQPLQLADRIDAELLDQPTYGLLRPQTTANTLAGALLGVLLGSAVVFILETLSANVIRERADIERTLKLPVLGTIPESEAHSA